MPYHAQGVRLLVPLGDIPGVGGIALLPNPMGESALLALSDGVASDMPLGIDIAEGESVEDLERFLNVSLVLDSVETIDDAPLVDGIPGSLGRLRLTGVLNIRQKPGTMILALGISALTFGVGLTALLPLLAAIRNRTIIIDVDVMPDMSNDTDLLKFEVVDVQLGDGAVRPPVAAFLEGPLTKIISSELDSVGRVLNRTTLDTLKGLDVETLRDRQLETPGNMRYCGYNSANIRSLKIGEHEGLLVDLIWVFQRRPIDEAPVPEKPQRAPRPAMGRPTRPIPNP